MKKLKLKLDGIGEELTKEQMKKINGGYYYCIYTVAAGCSEYGGPGPHQVNCAPGQGEDACYTYWYTQCDGDDCCSNCQC